MRVAVVGHVEWVDFVRVDHVPTPGEIVHPEEAWAEPGGGGAVAAVQLAKLAGAATLYTALGDDEFGRRAHRELRALGVRVEAAWRNEPQRRAFTFVDRNGERTITTLGRRSGPAPDDQLPWDELSETDAVYYTAGGAEALALARRARVLVATARELAMLKAAAIRLDAVVGSAGDPSERYPSGAVDPPPALVVRTEGTAGGTYETADGATGRYRSQPVPGPVGDAYGAGDSFAAGLTFGLGAGYGPERALELAARCGAAAVTGAGAFRGQLVLSPLYSATT